MDRINGTGHVGHRYVAEDVSLLRPPTEITPEAMNFFQEELVNVATMLGDALDPASESQVRDTLKRAIQQSRFNSASAVGTANAIAAVFDPQVTIATLSNGMTLYIRASAANTLAATTFTPNDGVVPAKIIVKGNNQPLVAGDIAGAGQWVVFQYDLTLDKWVMLNPATGLAAQQSFPSGTRLAFNQAAAPVGWTKDTTAALNDSILRIVSGVGGGQGGATGFSAFNTQTVTASFTLTANEMPPHHHDVGQAVSSYGAWTGGGNYLSGGGGSLYYGGSQSTTTVGSGASHAHGITTNIKYVDFIIGVKD